MTFFDVVMDDIRYLTAQKIQEILTYCEVSELQDETVRQHITGIANFGMYDEPNQISDFMFLTYSQFMIVGSRQA